jgi:cobalt-zinc-cadmium efflux system membrane fusion protein
MKKALFMLLTAALLAGCNKEDSKKPLPAPSSDPALVVPAPELLAQLKLATVTRPVAETFARGRPHRL